MPGSSEVGDPAGGDDGLSLLAELRQQAPVLVVPRVVGVCPTTYREAPLWSRVTRVEDAGLADVQTDGQQVAVGSRTFCVRSGPRPR